MSLLSRCLAESLNSTPTPCLVPRLFRAGCVGRTPPPTEAPTKAPTAAPTKVPTDFPTEVPTYSPTQRPTRSPTARPAPPPAPRCNGATYWVYNSTAVQVGGASARMLTHNSVTCLARPYNLGVRLCNASSVAPVRMRLVARATGEVVHARADAAAPYTLFGESALPLQLPNGPYGLIAKWTLAQGGAGGGSTRSAVVKFTQSCPCPKGRKGCMMRMARKK